MVYRYQVQSDEEFIMANNDKVLEFIGDSQQSIIVVVSVSGYYKMNVLYNMLTAEDFLNYYRIRHIIHEN